MYTLQLLLQTALLRDQFSKVNLKLKAQLTFTCSKSTIEALEKEMKNLEKKKKYVQS